MNPPTNHLGALTGMRFFAAMAVVVFHLIVDPNHDGLGRFGLPGNNAALGASAVSFFFVLSGFILTFVYKDQLTYGGVKKFYYKRWARIWPLHLVCLIIAVYVINMVINDYGKLVVNLALLQSWTAFDRWVFSFNGVSWSISTEMFFYFMFPFLLIGGQKRFWIKYVLLWVLVAGGLILMRSLEDNPNWSAYNFERIAHVNPFLRLPEFCTGMGVGFLFFNRAEKRKQRSIWFDTLTEFLALSLMPLFSWIYGYYKVTYQIRTAEWGGGSLANWVQVVCMMFVFAVVIYVFARSRGLFAKLLGSRPLVYLGEISFALYMIHFLVIIGMDRFDWSMAAPSPWVLGASTIAISLSLAAFLYTFVEMPAKSGLMGLYGGDFKKFFQAFPKALIKSIKSPTIWAFGLTLLISFGAVKSSQRPIDDKNRILHVVKASHGPYKGVDFGNEIRLLGAQAIATSKGVELRMAWEKRGELDRLRYLHLCDDDGNIVAQLAPEEKLYKEAKLGDPVLETCLIPSASLADETITQIGIGFYSTKINPETNKNYGMLVVSKGLRGMSNCRLYVIGQPQLKNLRRKISRLQGVEKKTEAAKLPTENSDSPAMAESH